jgi:Zn-dependent protease
MAGIDLIYIIKLLPGIVLGFTVHEYMHAKVAYLLGDSTAKDQGRVTLDPLKHIDWFGFIFIILAGFGWAKPVQIDRRSLKEPRRDEMLISVAGPLSNMVLAFVCAVIIKMLISYNPDSDDRMYIGMIQILGLAVSVNYGLFIFNMLPIPPLDGSHILFNTIRISAEAEHAIFKYGTLILFAVIIIQNQTHLNILPLGNVIDGLVKSTYDLLNIPYR